MGPGPAAASLPSGTVTLVFTDIEGSTKLLSDLGDTYRAVLDDHDRLLREVWTRHAGVEVNTEGDGFFVAFASPSAAVAAAQAAQRALAAHSWPHGGRLPVRMAVHTGEPQLRADNYWGIDVHYAARLCAAAHGEQVLLSAATRAMVPDAGVDHLGEHALKDFAAPRSIFHLVVGGRRSAEFPPPRTLESAKTNLPSMVTPLVGRETELVDLKQRLIESAERLVTVVGAGGTGKTRLAIACGQQLLDAFEHGVFMVPLAPVSDSVGVATSLAETVSAPGMADRGAETALIEHLRRRNVLLVIDNFEHVLDSAPLIARVLDAAPGIRILITSQAPLRLVAESITLLGPLELPVAGQTDYEMLPTVPAVELFVDRARAADPSFALSADNAAVVAELCRRLDGLPLALELAAARVRMAGVDGLLKALTRGVDALGRGTRDMPARQRGLRAALDWTVSLLGEEERRLFAGLGVFADAWTIEQAETVFGDELDLWEAMAALVDYSLIRTRGDGRLTMAERVRAHARELLAGSGRELELRRRHAQLMAETGEELTLELLLDLGGTIARTRDVLEEAEQAVRWSRAADPALYRRLLGAVARPFYFVSRLPAITDEVRRLAAAEDGADEVSGRVMIAQGMVDGLTGDLQDVVRWTGAAVECHRRTADRRTLISTMSGYAHWLTVAGRPAQARACIAEALKLAAGDADQRVRDQLEGTLAFAAVAEGDYDQAEARLQAILARPERTDFAAVAAMSYLADCALGRGDGEAALEHYASALRTEMAHTDANNAVLQLIGIAASLAVLNRDVEAAVTIGTVETISREIGMSRAPVMSGGVAGATLAELEQRLTADEWDRLRARGRGITLDQAAETAYALARPQPAVGRARPRAR